MDGLDLSFVTGFEWDKGNLSKNWLKHDVSQTEIEEAFFNQPLLLLQDEPHSTPSEQRWKLLGQTNRERYLLTVFTLRGNKIRPISARDISRKERTEYEKNA